MHIPTRSARPVAAEPVAASCATSPKRRRFLLTLGIGGAGAAVAVVAAAPAAAVEAVTTAPAVGNDGYRESAHVRDYYRTAKL